MSRYQKWFILGLLFSVKVWAAVTVHWSPGARYIHCLQVVIVPRTPDDWLQRKLNETFGQKEVGICQVNPRPLDPALQAIETTIHQIVHDPAHRARRLWEKEVWIDLQLRGYSGLHRQWQNQISLRGRSTREPIEIVVGEKGARESSKGWMVLGPVGIAAVALAMMLPQLPPRPSKPVVSLPPPGVVVPVVPVIPVLPPKPPIEPPVPVMDRTVWKRIQLELATRMQHDVTEGRVAEFLAYLTIVSVDQIFPQVPAEDKRDWATLRELADEVKRVAEKGHDLDERTVEVIKRLNQRLGEMKELRDRSLSDPVTRDPALWIEAVHVEIQSRFGLCPQQLGIQPP